MSQLMRLAIAFVWLLALFSKSAGAFESDVKSVVGYVGGTYSSIWIHEAGHALALKAFGATDIQINVPRDGCLLCGETVSKPVAGGFSASQTQAIAGAGLFAANLAGEVVMQRPSLHGGAFAQGVLGAALYSNAAHVYAYYTRRVGVDGYRGNDIDAYEAAGGNPHMLSAALLAYTAWTLSRMQKKEIPFFFVNFRF